MVYPEFTPEEARFLLNQLRYDETREMGSNFNKKVKRIRHLMHKSIGDHEYNHPHWKPHYRMHYGDLDKWR